MTTLHSPQTRSGRRMLGRAGAEVVVAIVDPAGLVGRLDRLLPRRWAVRFCPDLYQVTQPDILVLGDATAYLTAAARLLHPSATLAAVIPARDDSRVLADILHSGADVCVRAGATDVLAGHLLTEHQRRRRRSRVTYPVRSGVRRGPSPLAW